MASESKDRKENFLLKCDIMIEEAEALGLTVEMHSTKLENRSRSSLSSQPRGREATTLDS